MAVGERLLLGLLGVSLVVAWIALGYALFGESPMASAGVGSVLILLLAAFAAAWNQRAHWRRMACMEVQGLTMAQLRDCLSKLGASDSLDYGLDLVAVDVGVSRRSWGETVYAFATAPDRAFVLSRCTIPQFTSWRKNDDNLVVVAKAVLALGGRTSRRDRQVASARWHDISTRLGAST